MARPTKLTTTSDLSTYLSTTHPHWTSTNLIKLSGGTVNLICRGTLADKDAKSPHTTVIIKHAETLSGPGWSFPASRADDEQLVLATLHTSFAPVADPAFGAVVRTPELLEYLDDSYTLMMEDASEAVDMKSFLVNGLIGEEVASGLGGALGVTLDETVSRLGPGAGAGPLRDALRKNNNVRLKHAINYGRVEATIAMFQDVLMDLKNVLVELAAVSSFDDQDYEGVIHGDFWCGNVLIPSILPSFTEPNIPLALTVIDWELAQVSSPVYDLGQLFAELYLLYHFKARLEALTIIDAFLASYGPLPGDVAFRTAVHFGVHLVVWPPVTPGWGDGEQLKDCVRVGAGYIHAGLQRDRRFFAGGPLKGLFTSATT